MKIVREPRVYLVGRQTVDRGQIDRFLKDHDLTWETDTEVGAEVLAETAGRGSEVQIRAILVDLDKGAPRAARRRRR